MSKNNAPKPPKLTKARQAEPFLAALREARQAGTYPLTVEQLAACAHQQADDKLLKLLTAAEVKTAIVLAAKDLAAPIALAEDIQRLAESDALLHFAAARVRTARATKGPMRGDAKKFVGDAKLDARVKAAFQAAVERRCQSGTLPANVADLFAESSEALAARLAGIVKSQRHASADSCPVPLGRLLKMGDCDLRAKQITNVLKLPAFAGKVAACKAAGDGSAAEPAYVLRDDIPELLPKLAGLALRLAAHAAAKPKKGKAPAGPPPKSTLFAAKELAAVLMASKDDAEAFTAAVDGAASLGPDVAWLRLKGQRVYFRRQDVEPAGLAAGGAAAAVPHQPPHATAPAPAAPPADFPAAFEAAFCRVAARGSGWRPVLVHDLRAELPQFTREQFDAGLRALRLADRYTMDSSQGGDVRLTEEQRRAGIQEGSSLLVYVSRKS